jgi:hypothetical protein
MDMSDIKKVPAAAAGRLPAAGDPDRLDSPRWHALVSEVGAEIAGPLTAALERIHELTTTGCIERASLKALREEVEQARWAGMLGQQISRLATGRLRQSHERLQLTNTFKGVLAHRHRETLARGIVLKPVLKPVEVIVDATLLHTLINTTLDWALANARSQIQFTIDVMTWPAHGRITCQFAHRPADETSLVSSDSPVPPGLNGLNWRMLEQTAATMGLPLQRHDKQGSTTLTLEFPRTAHDEIEGVSTLEIDDGFAPSTNSKPLAGNHVLVVSSRREMRSLIRDALRNMGLVVDFVNSVEEASDFCRDGLPHAVVIEAIQNGERFARFRDEVVAEVPEFAFIEIIEEGNEFEMSGFSGTGMAKVGRDAIATSLPSALMYELSKGL